MKKFLFLFLIFLYFSSCSLGFYQVQFDEESVESRASSIVDLPSEENPVVKDKYSFLLVSDVHTGSNGYYKYKDLFFSWFKNQMKNEDASLRPSFAVSLGDNMDTGKEWEDYNTFISEIAEIASKNGVNGFKTYSTLGNHDLYHYGWENFKNHIYPYKSAYTFSDGTFSFYVLDSANGTLGNAQRKALKAKIEADKAPKIMLSHVPVYAGGCPSITFTIQNTMERNEILTLYQKNNVRQAFEGHAHISYGCNYGSWRENVIGSLKHGTICLVTVEKSTEKISSKIIEL